MALDERIKLSFKTVANKQRGYLTFDNSAVWLAGRLPSSGSPIVDPNPQTERDLIKTKIRELARYDNNLFKWWMFFYPHYFDHRNDTQSFFSPFKRNANRRWDLATPNDDYYEALDLAIRESMRHGIVVEIGLFDGPGLKGLNSGVGDASKRWPTNPWNQKNNSQGAITSDDQTGASQLFFTDPTIRQFQKKYVEEVVERTKQYWNVIYEIINEPGGDVTAEVAWANQVVGWIHAKTSGQRALFYNTFPDQRDITEFRKKNAAGQYVYPNYPNFHGVIFHGDPINVDPASANNPFSAEKAFQASSDGASGPRDTPDWNKSRTEHCFKNDMSFQAHATNIEAGQGISAALFNAGPNDQRQTVPLVPWRLIGRFHRRVPNENWDIRIFMDGVYVGFTSDRTIIDRGHITPIGRNRLKNVRGDGVTTTWQYSLDESHAVPRLLMTRDGDNFKQELDQVIYTGQFDESTYYDFLFNWERVYASDGSTHFSMRFDVDRSLIAYRLGTPNVDILRAEVKSLGSDAQGDFIIFFSAARGEERWSWRFLDNWTTLELSRPGFTERFAKRDAFRPAL